MKIIGIILKGNIAVVGSALLNVDDCVVSVEQISTLVPSIISVFPAITIIINMTTYREYSKTASLNFVFSKVEQNA